MSKQTLIHTFTKERARLTSLARRFLGNDSDAEDVVQDAFVRLWSRAEAINDQHHSDSSALLTVRNISIDSLRRQHNDMDIDNVMAMEDGASEVDEAYDIVEEIINTQLSDIQRRIITLRDYEEKEFDEIASMMNMQPTAVRMQLSRARKKIRDLYNERL